MEKAQKDDCTTGKSTIGDEKTWNVFMRLDTPEAQYVPLPSPSFSRTHVIPSVESHSIHKIDKRSKIKMGCRADPTCRHATGETEPVKVMAKLRELKNNM